MSDFIPADYNTMVVLAGTSLLGASAGLVGSYAVLRRRALVGDALSHAALPGVCLAFLVMREKNLSAMLCGAFASGVLGLAIITFLRARTRIKEDAAIGVVLSTFFGGGYALSRFIQNRVTGGSVAGVDTYILGRTAGMIFKDVLVIGGVSGLCLLVVLLLYKEFKVVAFDPGFACVQGWPAAKLDLLMMGLVAIAVVVGLPAVGVVLMSAMLIIPGAAARFWTDKLGLMLTLSAVFGAVVGCVGTLTSAQFSWSPAGPVIVLTGTAVFLVSLLAAPRRGVVAQWINRLNFRRRIRQQNMLRVIHELTEQDPRDADAAPLATFTLTDLLRHTSEPSAQAESLLNQLMIAGLVEPVSRDNYHLSDDGRLAAARLERGYRLWELFLTEHADLAGSYVDLDAEHIDQALPCDMVAELEGKLRRSGGWPRALTPAREGIHE